MDHFGDEFSQMCNNDNLLRNQLFVLCLKNGLLCGC